MHNVLIHTLILYYTILIHIHHMHNVLIHTLIHRLIHMHTILIHIHLHHMLILTAGELPKPLEV